MARPRGTTKDRNLFLDEGQLAQFFKAISNKDRFATYDWSLIFRLVLTFGMRVSELAGLQLQDVYIAPNLADSTITIRGRKNGRIRTYSDLDSKLIRSLREWLITGRKKIAHPQNPFVFPSRSRSLHDQHISENAIKERFYNYCKDAGLPSYFSVHHLRSSSAILWAKQGKSPIEIMRWLRLKSISSAKVYYDRQDFPEMDRQAKDIFKW